MLCVRRLLAANHKKHKQAHDGAEQCNTFDHGSTDKHVLANEANGFRLACHRFTCRTTDKTDTDAGTDRCETRTDDCQPFTNIDKSSHPGPRRSTRGFRDSACVSGLCGHSNGQQQ